MTSFCGMVLIKLVAEPSTMSLNCKRAMRVVRQHYIVPPGLVERLVHRQPEWKTMRLEPSHTRSMRLYCGVYKALGSQLQRLAFVVWFSQVTYQAV